MAYFSTDQIHLSYYVDDHLYTISVSCFNSDHRFRGEDVKFSYQGTLGNWSYPLAGHVLQQSNSFGYM